MLNRDYLTKEERSRMVKLADIETSNNLISLEDLLNSGKKECEICHKGFYKPFNPRYKVNHSFQCDYCGKHLTLEPNINIE